MKTIKIPLNEQYPHQPWKWREDWVNGLAKPNEIRLHFVTVINGLFMLAVTLPISIMAILKSKGNIHPSWLSFFFPLIGALMAWNSWKRHQKLQSVGAGGFSFSDTGVLGGKLNGAITLGRSLHGGSAVTVKLRNVRTYAFGLGDSSGRRSEVLWETAAQLTTASNGETAVVPIDFEIPFDRVPSFGEPANFQQAQTLYWWHNFKFKKHVAPEKLDVCHWELVVEVGQPVVRLTYDVPVFRTEQSDSSKTEFFMTKKGYVAPSPRKSSGIKVVPSMRGMEIQILKQGLGSTGVAFSLFGLLLLLAGGTFSWNLWKTGGFFLIGLPMGFILLLIGFVLLQLGLSVQFQKVKIILTDLNLIVEKKLFFFRQVSQVPYEEIKNTILKSGAKSQTEEWFNISLERHRQPALLIPVHLSNRQEALWVAQQILDRAPKKIAA
jgi:hypothetical protein